MAFQLVQNSCAAKAGQQGKQHVVRSIGVKQHPWYFRNECEYQQMAPIIPFPASMPITFRDEKGKDGKGYTSDASHTFIFPSVTYEIKGCMVNNHCHHCNDLQTAAGQTLTSHSLFSISFPE